MQSSDSRLHNADILDYIHHDHETRPVQVQTLQKTTAFYLFAMGMNGIVPFDVKSGIIKTELLAGILHNLQWYQCKANNGTSRYLYLTEEETNEC